MASPSQITVKRKALAAAVSPPLNADERSQVPSRLEMLPIGESDGSSTQQSNASVTRCLETHHAVVQRCLFLLISRRSFSQGSIATLSGYPVREEWSNIMAPHFRREPFPSRLSPHRHSDHAATHVLGLRTSPIIWGCKRLGGRSSNSAKNRFFRVKLCYFLVAGT